MADAVEELLPGATAVRCKWPNDVLVGGRKVAGILLESSTSAAGLLDWVVIGIGVNVASHPPDGETMYPATSLAAEGAAGVGVEQALERSLPPPRPLAPALGGGGVSRGPAGLARPGPWPRRRHRRSRRR